MELPRLQYITHPDEQFEDLSWVHRLHDCGVRWIQLRLKEEDVYRRFPTKHYRSYFHEIADKLRAITTALDMMLTINDAADVAVFSHADGLHIGQEDGDPKWTFQQLKKGQLLGGTANSLQEVLHFDHIRLDYFGVGPFRDTVTKKVTKPQLGLAGYVRLLEELHSIDLRTPVYAIGGIQKADIQPLLQKGVYGIALSGLFFKSGHDREVIQSIMNELKEV